MRKTEVMKKVLSILLCLSLVLSYAPVTAFAAEGETPAAQDAAVLASAQDDAPAEEDAPAAPADAAPDSAGGILGSGEDTGTTDPAPTTDPSTTDPGTNPGGIIGSGGDGEITDASNSGAVVRPVTIADMTNGTVTADMTTAAEGETVTLTVTPDEGCELETLTVTDGAGNSVPVTENTFIMPAMEVTVSATFKEKAAEPAETNTIYFDNSAAQWSPVYAYAWGADNSQYLDPWPGTAMTLVEGETAIYSVSVPAGAETIIFNNGSGAQTANLTLGTGNCFKAGSTNADGLYIGSWYTYPCTHADMTCTDNGDGTHSSTCAECGSILAENEAHTYDPATGKCDTCGIQLEASVTTAEGGTTYYGTFDDAITAAGESTGSTLTLLADVTGNYTVSSGTFTLDLNGKTITSSNLNTLEIRNTGTDVIITDGAGGGKINGVGTGSFAVRVFDGGRLTIRGGTFTGTNGVRVGVDGFAGGSVIIESGTFQAAGAAVYVENSQGSATIKGGNFIGKDCAIGSWGTLIVTGAPTLTIENGDAPIRYCGGTLDLSGAECDGWVIANYSGNDLTVGQELLIPEGHAVHEIDTANQIAAIATSGEGEISDHIHSDMEEDGDHNCDTCGKVCSGHTFGSDGKCVVCGEPAAMRLTFADGSTLYTDGSLSLLEDTEDGTGSDITCIRLLRNFGLEDALAVGSTTLDLNGFTLTCMGVASMGDLTVTGPGSITGGYVAVTAVGKLTILGSPTLTVVGIEDVPGFATIMYYGSQIDLSQCTGCYGWTIANEDVNEGQMPVSNILLSAHGSVEDAQGNPLAADAAVDYEGIVFLRESSCTDAADDRDHNCDICGKENTTEHTYSDADCTTPATCSECGATDGEALGHTDENTDHYCDTCCRGYMGEHTDNNTDHACDYGCADPLGSHADIDGDGDHICDYCKDEDNILTSCSYGWDAEENLEEATCTAPGSYDSVAYCGECGKELSRVTVSLTATGHNWADVTYQWNIGCTTCTATRTCLNDAFHEETAVTTSIEGNQIKPATCTDEGEMQYIASFAEDWAAEYSELVAIPVTNHSWDAYTNNGNGTHNVSYTCHEEVREANVSHTYNLGVCVCGQVQMLTYTLDFGGGVLDETMKEMLLGAGCTVTEDSVSTSAPYGEALEAVIDGLTKEGYTLTGFIDQNGQEYGIGNVIPLTEDIILTAQWEINEYTVTWAVDGETFTTTQVRYGDPITAPADPAKAPSGCTTYTFESWEGFTDGMTQGARELTFHARFTEGERHTDGDTNHHCDNGCGKTDMGVHADGNRDHACDYGCSDSLGAHRDSPDDTDHVCDYGCGVPLEACYDQDGDGDHECDICGKTDVSEHDFSVAADCENPAACSECGETTGTELGHTWEAADCDTPKTCSVCQATEGEALGHTWAAADCDTPKTCSVCQETEGEALGHTWAAADCDTPKTCAACQETEGEALGHTWAAADCDTPKTCSVCQATEGEALGHTWAAADCDTPKTCAVCQATEGEALGHTWAAADCDTPKTCSVCQATEGEALGHTPGAPVEENRVESTCTAAGSYDEVVYCSVCKTHEISRVKKLLPLAEHAPGEGWLSDADGHWQECECGEKLSGGSHADGGDTDTRCDLCGYDTHTHSYGTEWLSNDGNHWKVCACGAVTQQAAHTKATREENRKDATCKAEGSYEEVVSCTVCEAELSRTEKTLDKLPHTEESIPGKAATCTETGLTDGTKCGVCGEILKEQETISKLAHTPGEAVRENEAAATCKEAGSYDEVVSCSVCGTEISRTRKTIDKLTTHTDADGDEICDVCGADLGTGNDVTIEEPDGGKVEIDDETPATGEDVTITVTPDEGKEIDKVTVTDKDGNPVEVTDNGDGTYTYEQPDGDVNIEVTFKDEVPAPDTDHDVTIEEPDGGKVEIDDETPATGEDVTITVTPDEGKEIDKVTVTDKDGNPVEVTDNGDGTYTYEQPDGDVTIEVTFKTVYEIVKGNGGKWTKGSTSTLSFTANGPLDKFTGIQVDGKAVDAKNYTTKADQTTITLKASYLETLKTGKHTITVLYTDGETEGTFTVQAKSASPATGDASNIMLWSTLMCVSTLGLMSLLADRKRKIAK